MADRSWLTAFPSMDRSELVSIRKALDGAYREFSRNYGDSIEASLIPCLIFWSGLSNCSFPLPGG